MVMLGVTVGLYYVDLSKALGWVGWNVVVAMIVAIIKATAVVLIFMNVRNSTRLTWLWAALGFIWLLLMTGIFMDYQTRAWIDQTGWTAIPSEYEIGGVSSRPAHPEWRRQFCGRKRRPASFGPTASAPAKSALIRLPTYKKSPAPKKARGIFAFYYLPRVPLRRVGGGSGAE